MRPERAIQSWLLLAGCLSALVLTGCASRGAPEGWLPAAEEAAAQARGAWLRLDYRDGSRAPRVFGEFIAAHPDTVFVLDSEGLIAVPLQAITEARLTTYDAQADVLGAWTALGSLSTLSHGFFLAISLPVWLVGGISITNSQAGKAREDAEDTPWEQLTQYARFPQGIPPGVDRALLVTKPYVLESKWQRRDMQDERPPWREVGGHE